MIASKSFNAAASTGDTDEEKAIDSALASAMESPSKLGKPDRSLPHDMASDCTPDLTRCPSGWEQRGVLCYAGVDYSGACARQLDLSEMGTEQKLAVARHCQVQFLCQDNCAPDFRHSCPSLWRETSRGVCAAPANYDGDCNRIVQTLGMSEEQKLSFSTRCGVRWPCTPAESHDYSDVCPSGWSLEFGQVCSAPEAYQGPCEHEAHMNDMSRAEKKTFEAKCNVKWPAAPTACLNDFSASCPFGWLEVTGGECRAPPTYTGCSKVQQFGHMSLAEKQDWGSKCSVSWPC